MKSFRNGKLSNGLGILILLITAVIAVNQMNSVVNKIRDIVAPTKTTTIGVSLQDSKTNSRTRQPAISGSSMVSPTRNFRF